MNTGQRGRIVVAVNPAAAFGRSVGAGALVGETVARAGFDPVVLKAASYTELSDLVRAALVDAPGRAASDALLVVGGDGMVALGVNIVATTAMPLGIVPTGTGNDLARGLGIPIDDIAAATALALAAIETGGRTIDAGRVRRGEAPSDDDTWFAGVASAGFDALVNERANRMRWPRGPWRYRIGILAELVRLRSRTYEISIDGAPAERLTGALVCVANNSSFGGGIRIAPNAVLDDGLLDLVIVASVTRRRFLAVYPKVADGGHLREPEVRVERVREVRIAAEGIVAYADGERVGSLPITVTVHPRALRVLV